jgi:hypothetical protein
VVNVSGPIEVPVPNEHPDDDLLADLAAEVLPDDLAERVQHHVMSCARCEGLLAEAEGIRSLLRQGQPEPMPTHVLARLERALIAARQEDESTDGSTDVTGRRSSGPATDMSETAETRPLTRLPIEGPARVEPGRRIARTGPATGRIAATGPLTGSITAGPKTGRLSRMSAPAQSARRQAMEEQRADRPSRLAPMLRVAAAVIVVLGIGGVALQLRGNGDASDEAGTAVAGRVTAAPILAPVQSSSTEYTKKALSRQVKTLIADSQQRQAQEGVQSRAAAGGDAATKDSDDSAASRESPSTLAAQGQQQLLRSPEALRACLTAIGEPEAQPLAVDLARYAGREAAIIVLAADGGGYDVWVVARDCRAGNDGTIDFVQVDS